MIKDFIKTKSIGYFMAAGIALLSLITAIIFFATQEGNMGNYASGVGPETIGVFLLAGFVVELVLLVLPQYRFIHIIALVMFGLAFYKETILIPDFIAGKINNVEYNGGSFNLNMLYFILLFIIVVVSIVVAFLGFYKDDEVAKKEMGIEKNVTSFVKVGAGAAVVVAAVLVGSLVSKGIVDNSAANTDPLITKSVRKAANDCEYYNEPSTVVMPEREITSADYNSIRNYPTNGDAPYEDAYLVYRFEGAYAEGYQGDYSQTYAYLYLWDNGTFTGEAGTTNQGKIRGYWFNDENDDGVKDCLKMVSNVSRYESIICQEASGFYQWQAYIYLRMSWNGDRSIIVNGYEYYPDVAIVIDNNGTEMKTPALEDFDISFWQAKRVLKTLDYTAVFIPTEVDWYIEDGSGEFKRSNSGDGVKYETEEGSIYIEYVDGNSARGIASMTANFNNKGTKKVVAKWGEFSTSINVKVSKALPQEEE